MTDSAPHTLINPQANRAVGPAQQADPFLAARVKDETDAGIVIRGARMLARSPPPTNSWSSSTLLRSTEEDAPTPLPLPFPAPPQVCAISAGRPTTGAPSPTTRWGRA